MVINMGTCASYVDLYNRYTIDRNNGFWWMVHDARLWFSSRGTHTPTDLVSVRIRRPGNVRSQSHSYDGSETGCHDDGTIRDLMVDWKNRRGRRRPL
jgi:hypothetical protein